MTTATLTHRIPREALTVKPTITFSEAFRKVNAKNDAGTYINQACAEVFEQHSIRMVKTADNYSTHQKFAQAIYNSISSARKRSRQRRAMKKGDGQEKAQTPATTPTATPTGDFKAFYLSVKGIMDMPLSAAKKVEVIRAIL